MGKRLNWDKVRRERMEAQPPNPTPKHITPKQRRLIGDLCRERNLPTPAGLGALSRQQARTQIDLLLRIPRK